MDLSQQEGRDGRDGRDGPQEDQEENKLEETNQSEHPGALEHKVTVRLHLSTGVKISGNMEIYK